VPVVVHIVTSVSVAGFNRKMACEFLSMRLIIIQLIEESKQLQKQVNTLTDQLGK